MKDLLNVSASPHVRSNVSTTSIMRDVVIALIPAAAFGVYNFGTYALLLIVATIATCVLTEYFYQKFMKKPITAGDYSAVLTGLLLALNLPPELPIWIAILGGVFAILIVKQLFGGLGQNFMNPALAARCFLVISFAGRMTEFTYKGMDAVTYATPLAVLKGGNVALPVEQVLSSGAYATSIWEMFLGTTGGTIGETSTIAILIGALYLFAKKIISWRIPLTYIGSFSLFILLFGGRGFDLTFLAAHLCGGGLMLGAFFMATDYVTSPITSRGKIIFGIVLGCLTGIFRIFGGTAEGVSYAIIITNLFVPLIERVTIPTPFGKEGMKHDR